MTIEINRSNNQDIDGLLYGWAWGNGGAESLTFSFPTSTAGYTGYAAINGFSSFNPAQQVAVRNVLTEIASFCNLTFTETTSPDAALRYAEATSTSFDQDDINTAYAFPPQPGIPTDVQGDSWFHISKYDNPLLGGYKYFTIMHETGHSLGLKHGHETQTSHGVTFPTLPYAHDSLEYSVMTYRQFPGDNPLNGYNNQDFPTTYMQDDIAALQYMYGANYGASAHNGDTVYTWSPTTGEASIDGIGQGRPWHNFVFMTIWDGGGNDTYDFSNYTTNLWVDLRPGKWTVLDTSVARAQQANLGDNGAGGPTDFAANIANALTDPHNPSTTLSLIENAVGGTGNDILVGNVIGNTLVGKDGNDQLHGLGGVDTMYGGSGDDLYRVDDVGDVAVEVSNGVGSGYDVVFSFVSYTLGFGIESLVLDGLAANGTGNAEGNSITGTSGINVLSGLDGNDFLLGYEGDDTLLGGNGNDSLDGDTGADIMDGGNGNDVYTVDDASDVAEESSVGSGEDTIHSSVSYLLGYGIENLTLTGTVGLTGVGNQLHNTINGNSSNNILSGLDGNDQLNGGAGNDVLNGGAGTDTASYATATVGVTANLSLPGAQNTVGAGSDTLTSIEHLVGSAFNDTLTGNTGSNSLTGGNGNDTLNGGAGNDVLNGGVGTDTASYATATVGVTVNVSLLGAQNTVGAGTDTLTSIEYLIGSAFNDTLTGNAGNNSLTGGNGNDTLNGGSGNDTLIGGIGLDTLNGGVGNDLFDYNAVNESPVGTSRDKIVGFAGAGTAIGDKIDLATIDANTVLSGNQTFIWGGSFTAGHLRYVGGVLQGNTDADAAVEFEIQLVGSPGLVVGGAGTDILL